MEGGTEGEKERKAMWEIEKRDNSRIFHVLQKSKRGTFFPLIYGTVEN